MRKYLTVTLIVFLLFSLANVTLPSERAFVLNGLSETISEISLSEGTVDSDVFVTGNSPNQIRFHDSKIYVVNSGSHTINVVDPGDYSSETIELPLGCQPYFMAFNDTLLAVTGYLSDSVYFIDKRSSVITEEFALPESNPEGILFKDGRLLVSAVNYNSSDYSFGEGKVLIYDVSSLSLLANISVPKNPQRFLVGSDGLIHVLCTGNYSEVEGKIVSFSAESLTVKDTLEIGGYPSDFVLGDSGNVYVATNVWGETPIRKIVVYNSSTLEPVYSLEDTSNDTRGTSLMGIDVDSENDIYVCSFDSNWVEVYNSDLTHQATYLCNNGTQDIAIGNYTGIGERYTQKFRGNRLRVSPNPFSSKCRIKVDISKGTEVSLKLLDMEGKVVESLYRGTLRAGDHTFYWAPSGSNSFSTASGNYKLLLQTCNYQKSKDIIYLK